jgi:hypothetical protein
VNALATTGTSQGNLLAGLTTPVLTANATLATPAFVSLIGLFLSSPTLASPQQQTAAPDTAKTSATVVSPAQIADAMIRSMLGNQLGQLGNPVIATATANPAPLFVATTNPIYPAAAPSVTDLPLNIATAPATTNLAATLMTVAAAPPNGAKPNTGSLNQAMAEAPRKQLRGPADVAIITGQAIAPAAVFISSSAVALPTSATNVAASSGPLENNTTNSPAKTSPAGAIAFTAILTPVKEMAVVTSAPETTRQIAIPPQPATSAPASTTWQGSQSQTESQASIVHANLGTAGGGAQQGGDTSQQHQGNSPETPAPLTGVSTDTKIKLAVVKQDDGATQPIASAATGTLHPTPIAPISSIADQAHAATATQSDATATPFRSAADALRTSEPNMPAAPQLRTGAVQEISIRIAPPDAPPVDLRVVERSGQVHIDVRTPDAGMQTSLRQDLGTLTNSLQRAGYHTETFTPSSSLARAASSAQMSNQDDRQDPSQNRGGAGNFSEGRRQQQQQKRPGTRLGELEDQK